MNLPERDSTAFDNWASRVIPVRQVDVHRNRVRGGRGVLQVDNRASGGQLEEFNTLTCAHCSVVVVLRDNNFTRAFPGTAVRTRERNYCQKCHAYICDTPGCNHECNPREQTLELALKYPEKGIQLGRDKQGNILFDPELRDREKIY